MQYTVPHYYRKFVCTAAKCPDTCCAGWEIVIDEKSLKKYRRQRGPFGSRLRNSIDWRQGTFRQYGHRCEFLNEDDLCDIYSELGPKMLCTTCRKYPRHIEEFEGLREISLSLSCPEAAKLILGSREPVRFLTGEKQTREERYRDFDFLLFTKLTDARELLLEILQDRQKPLNLRLGMGLALCHDLQQRLDKNQIYQTDPLLERYGKASAFQWFSDRFAQYEGQKEQRCQIMEDSFSVFERLEVLREEWSGQVKKAAELLYGKGSGQYASMRSRFLRETKECWELWGEQLAVYFLFTYFCGAVYDGRAFEKMKLAVMSTLWIQELAQAQWQEQGGTLEFTDIVKAAYTYSREIEHSDKNLDMLEGEIFREEAFSLERLFLCVLN